MLKKTPLLRCEEITLIESILERGNSVEIKSRKTDVIILEIKKQIKAELSKQPTKE